MLIGKHNSLTCGMIRLGSNFTRINGVLKSAWSARAQVSGCRRCGVVSLFTPVAAAQAPGTRTSVLVP